MSNGAQGSSAPGSPGRPPRVLLLAARALVPLLLLAACGDGAGAEPDAGPSSPATSSRSGDPSPGASVPVADPDHAVDPPGRLDGRLYPADMLISSRRPRAW